MDEKLIKEVFSDEAFVSALLELETPVEVQAALKEKGIDMTESEIVSLRDEIVKQAQKVNDGEELSVDQLDDVAGGMPTLVTGLIAVAVVGVAAGAGIFGAVGLIGLKMRRW